MPRKTGFLAEILEKTKNTAFSTNFIFKDTVLSIIYPPDLTMEIYNSEVLKIQKIIYLFILLLINQIPKKMLFKRSS
jgi:predicted small integral membrane protein